MILRCLFVCVLFVLLGCGNGADKPAKQPAATTPPPAQEGGLPTSGPAAPSADANVKYPSIPEEEVKRLWDNCDNVDFIFYNIPISMNMDEDASVKQCMRYIATTPPDFKDICKPAGRVFFLKEGEKLIEADFYFSESCTFFVFYKDGKPAYSNLMTELAYPFFTNIISNAPKQ